MAVLFTLAFPFSAAAQETMAEGISPALIHVGHVTEHFAGTPEAQGLLTTAMAEARIVAQHAALGAQDPGNLEAMQRHAGHIIHAIAPGEIEEGPGTGFGLVRAAEGVVRHGSLAGKSQGATQAITTHSPHVATAAQNTVRRAQQILALAQTIREHVETPAEAAAIFADLRVVADQLVSGADADGDGRITWQDREGGLQQVEQHAGFMTQGSN
jgi:hypothetical protein